MVIHLIRYSEETAIQIKASSYLMMVITRIHRLSLDLDTSSLGAQNITYSAPSDAAGNIPDSINRTVTVLAKPLAITTLTITSSNANSLHMQKLGM